MNSQNNTACYRYLDEEGRVVAELPAFARDPETLHGLYRWMVLTRTFDAKAVSLQRTGRLGTYATSLGQEAVAVAIGAALRADDVLLPSFREQGAQLMRNVSMVELFSYWGGDERGSCFAKQNEDFPICVPVGSHAPHAAGVALAFKLRRQERVAVCVLGDGATSKGDFYEAMNFAGVQNLPLVFVVNNNQWAISVPRRNQTAAPTLAAKALSAGIAGEQIDGNDVIATKACLEDALARARAGGGPSLVEAVTYRLGDHTTADDARRYRDDQDVSAHWKQEPISRLRNFMVGQDCWGKDQEEDLIRSCREEVEEAAALYESRSPQPVESMFDWLYETLPDSLKEQRQALIDETRASARRNGDGNG